MDEHDLTDPHGENERLRRWNKLLRATLAASRAPDPAVNAGSCQPGDLISRAAAIEAATARYRDNGEGCGIIEAIRAIPAAPVADAQPVVLGVDLASGPDQTVEWRWETTLEHIARDMREGRFPAQSERQCIVATSPVPPTIGGAELDALVARLRKAESRLSFQSRYMDDARAVSDAITALRAQPDWKAMAERLGDVLGDALIVLEEADTAGSQVAADARAALSDLAKMRSASK